MTIDVKRLKRIPDRLVDEVFEHALNIQTGGYKDVRVEGHVHYGTIGYRGSFAIVRKMGNVSGKVLLDVGCGKGRFMACAAQFRFSKVIGIEYDEELYELARANVRKLRRRRSELFVSNCLAEEYAYGSEHYYYLFNPFSAEILRTVLEKIGKSRKAPVQLIYVNPRQEEVFKEVSWLEKDDEWGPGTEGIGYRVAFWRSRD